MTLSECAGWLLAVVICLVVPLALGYWHEAIAGTVALAVLAWLLKKKHGEGR